MSRTRSVSRSAAGRIASVVAIIAVIGVADRPVYAAADLVTPPSLLYMTPAASLPPVMLPPYPYTPPDLAVGVLVFDGSTDPVSGDDRLIELQTPIDDDACVPSLANPNDASCTTVNLSVGVEGSLTVAGRGAVADVFLEGAVIIDVSSPQVIAVRGKVDDVNAALKTLTYTPDTDYYYDGSDPAELTVSAAAGDGSGGFSGYSVELRVLDYNDPVTLTVPSDKTVPSGDTELEISSVTAAPGDPDDVNPAWMIEDEDNDENDGNSLVDGAGTAAIVALWATCGWLEAPRVTGFTFSDNLESLLVNDVLLDPLVAAAIVDAVELASPEFATALLATGNPSTTPLTGFVGYAGDDGTIDINYLLSQVIFHTVNPADAADVLTNATCEVFTVVSDLGNNGLPFSGTYVEATGVAEIPFPTVAVDWFNVQVGEGTAIDASFNPTTYDVDEGLSTMVNIDITTDPASPGTHPAFDLTLSVAPGDSATPGSDYDALPVTVTVPEDATSVMVPIDTLDDATLEGTETITLTIAAPSQPPSNFRVTTEVPTAVVSILDDEVDPSTTTTSMVDDSTTTTSLVDDSTTTTSLVDDSTTTTSLVDDSTTTTSLVDDSTTTTSLVDDSTTTTSLVDDSTTTTTSQVDATTTSQPSGGAPTTSVGPGSGAGVPTTIVPPFTVLPETGGSIARILLVASALVALGVLARRGVGVTPRRG